MLTKHSVLDICEVQSVTWYISIEQFAFLVFFLVVIFARCPTLVNSPVFHPRLGQRGAHCASEDEQRRLFPTYRRACGTQTSGRSQHQPINRFADDLLRSLGSDALGPAVTNVSEEGVPTRTLVDEHTRTVAREELINFLRRLQRAGLVQDK